jgi:hypothetical protein
VEARSSVFDFPTDGESMSQYEAGEDIGSLGKYVRLDLALRRWWEDIYGRSP